MTEKITNSARPALQIEIETCSERGGDVRIIASSEDPAVIRIILAHLDEKGMHAADSLLPDCRASPGLAKEVLILSE